MQKNRKNRKLTVFDAFINKNTDEDSQKIHKSLHEYNYMPNTYILSSAKRAATKLWKYIPCASERESSAQYRTKNHTAACTEY